MSTEVTVSSPSLHTVVNCSRLRKTANWLLRHCQVADCRLGLHLVDDRESSRLNSQYRQKNGPTNVLSFPFGGNDDSFPVPGGRKELGEIIISVETATREAGQLQQSLEKRLEWLLIHGLLHLLGHDHERSPEDAESMFDLEKNLSASLHSHRRTMMTKLAINVDHVATIRQARGVSEPDPVTAAALCELAGAAGIVVHLREDRRHIQDRDVRLLRQTVQTKLNLEMGANKEIIGIALEVKPDLITLVPEKRQELTTEGGLDVLSQKKKIAKVVEKMTKSAIPVSIFADPDPEQLRAASEIGATFVELHTGRYADAASDEKRSQEFRALVEAAEAASQYGLRVCAGHGLNYQNTSPIAAIDSIEELSIGHAVISRAVLVGLDQAVREMLALVQRGDEMI